MIDRLIETASPIAYLVGMFALAVWWGRVTFKRWEKRQDDD
jgi:hypothetical protein